MQDQLQRTPVRRVAVPALLQEYANKRFALRHDAAINALPILHSDACLTCEVFRRHFTKLEVFEFTRNKAPHIGQRRCSGVGIARLNGAWVDVQSRCDCKGTKRLPLDVEFLPIPFEVVPRLYSLSDWQPFVPQMKRSGFLLDLCHNAIFPHRSLDGPGRDKSSGASLSAFCAIFRSKRDRRKQCIGKWSVSRSWPFS